MPAMGMEGMASMMQTMMRNMMGGGGPKPIYPSLMSFPAMNQQQRTELLEQAESRVRTGTEMIRRAQLHINQSTADANLALWAASSAQLREGLSLVESGMAARSALRGEHTLRDVAPSSIALTWFKRQLGLAVDTGQAARGLVDSSSTFHMIAMAGLAGFGLFATFIWWQRSRRVSALLGRLDEQAPNPIAPTQSVPIPSVDIVSEVPKPTTPISPIPDIPAQIPRTPEAKAGLWRGKLRVVATFQETSSIKTFRMAAPDGRSIPFDYIPGQYLSVTMPGQSGTLKRSYTIASSPTQRDYVEITVKREEKGAVSAVLHSNVAVGDLLEIEAPRGNLTFTGIEANSIVLIGGGVGATPLMSVLRYLTDRAWSGDVYYLYSCRTSADFLFRDEIEQRQRRHANLHVFATMTRAAGTVWIGPEGRITKEFIAQFVPRIAQCRVHICGPEPMMAEMRRILDELDVPKSQVKTEAFGTTKRAAPTPSATPIGPSFAPSAVVTFARSGKTAPLPAGISVLEAAEGVGVSIDNSCRSGTCGTCKVRLLAGQVTMAVEDGLDPAEKSQGWILACQAQSSANISVDA